MTVVKHETEGKRRGEKMKRGNGKRTESGERGTAQFKEGKGLVQKERGSR